ncbi:MAG: hypothetical protein ACXW02_07330 [Halobacteriota archaeon]
MTLGTERDDCNIDNIDEYHAMRDEALTNVKAPPPSEYDIAQFKEAFADDEGEYDYDGSERNAKQRALIWYSDTLYSASELSVIMPKVVPHYKEFDGVKTIQLLTGMYPEAYFLPSREYGVAIFVYPPNGTTALKKPNKIEMERLKADSYTIHVILREDKLIHVIELWFD